jgi:hypothetical protein
MITRNDKGFHEMLTDKFHENIIMGLTRIANVPCQDTDLIRPGRDLLKKGFHVFDALQMEVREIPKFHYVIVY